MLLALGALDGAERMYQGNYRVVIFTEDTDNKKRYLKIILKSNGFNDDDVLIRSYEGSSQFQAAALLTKFIKDIRPGVQVILHRDRDFMTEAEITVLKERYMKSGVSLFITNGSDIEASFATAEHIVACTGLAFEEVRSVINQVLGERAAIVAVRFAHKRKEVKTQIYAGRMNECPSTEDMMPGGQVRAEHAIGKDLNGWVIQALEQKKLARGGDLMKPSAALENVILKAVAAQVYTSDETIIGPAAADTDVRDAASHIAAGGEQGNNGD